MHALTGFVNSDDVDIASIAVAAVKNLASHGDNFSVLRLEEALMDGLKDLLLSDDADRDLRRDVFHILEELTDENNDDEMDELDELERKAGLVEKPSTVFDDPDLLTDPVTARLHVPGITDDVFCVRIEQLLIRKRGVISVVFEIGAEIAVVYTRAPPEELASFVSKMTGTPVELLPPEPESEDEEEQPGIPGEQLSDEKENGGGQPGYLDETGQRLQDVVRRNAKKKHTITQGASSLAERLKAQREEESRKKARANRLMDSIGRGFSSGWGLW